MFGKAKAEASRDRIYADVKGAAVGGGQEGEGRYQG